MPQSPTIVYVGNSDSQDITILELGANGTLTPRATVPVPGPAKPGGSLPLAVSPDKRFLYVGLRNEPYSVVTFAIDGRSGSLAYIGSGLLADSMAYIACDRTGRYLLSASYGGDKVTVSPIGETGVPGAARQIVTGVSKAHSIAADPSNRFVLYASLGGDRVHQQRFDAKTGTLRPNDPPSRSVRAKAGPRHFVFSPDERFVYLLNELDATVSVFPYEARTGTLGEEAQAVRLLAPDFTGKSWAADIHLTPDGKFLYASERTTSTLAAFRIDTRTGRLTGAGSYPTVKQPRAFAIDPTSRFLLAVGQLSHTLMAYSIDSATGSLTKLAEYPVGKNPNWVEIVPLP